MTPEASETLWRCVREDCLTNSSRNGGGHLLKVGGLNVLGSGIAALTTHDRSVGPDILGMMGRYTHSQDPR